MKNIVLIGMPGSGKSTFGKSLAKELGMDFFDADDVLEEREARSIKSFFAESEEAFRTAETRTLKYLATLGGAVIATGGGAVKREQNMQLLKQSGVVVFIDRAPQKILACIEGDARPLLAADKQRIFTLYDERIALYRQYADYIVDNNRSMDEVLQLLLAYARAVNKD